MSFPIVVAVLNLFGLGCSFLGTVLMFRTNPKIDINAGQLPDEETLIEAVTNRRTKQFRFGMLILSIGFLIQFVSLGLSFARLL